MVKYNLFIFKQYAQFYPKNIFKKGTNITKAYSKFTVLLTHLKAFHTKVNVWFMDDRKDIAILNLNIKIN